MKIKLPSLLYKVLMTLMSSIVSVSLITTSTASETTSWKPNIEYSKTIEANADSGGWGISGTSGVTGDHILSSNTSIIFKSAGNVGTPFNCTGLHIKLATTDKSQQMQLNADMIASSLWFNIGRYQSSTATRLTKVGSIYVVGGQLYLSGENNIIADITLGTSTYTETGSAYNNAALRVNANTTLTKVSIVENTKITMGGGKTLTIGTMTGTNTVNFDSFDGENIINLSNSYNGAIHVTAIGGKQSLVLQTNNSTYNSVSLTNNTNLKIANDVSTTINSLSEVTGSSIVFGNSNSKLTINNTGTKNFAGTLIGAGTLAISDSGHIVFSGASGSAFTGTVNMNKGIAEWATPTNATYYGKLAGSGTFKKSGVGTLTVNNNNGTNFTGSVDISAGTLQIASSNFITSQNNVTIGSAAILQIKGEGPISVSLGNLTMYSGSTLALNLSAIKSNVLTVNQLIAGTSGQTTNYKLAITATDSIFTSGSTYDLMTVTNTSSQLWSFLLLDNNFLSRGQSASLKWENNILKMTISGTVTSLTWNGSTGNMIWDKTATNKNWLDGNTADYFHEKDAVVFGSKGAGSVTIADTIIAHSVTVNGGNYTFTSQNNGKLSGNGKLTISGGTVNLNLSNDYTGGTVVNNGTLNINTAGATGSGTISVIGGNLNVAKEALSSIKSIDIQGGSTNLGSKGNTIASGTYNTTFSGKTGSSLKAWLSGDENSNDTGAIFTNLSNYKGTLEICSGLLNVSDNTANASLSGLEKITLNGGGLLFKDSTVTINKHINVSEGTTGLLRPYQNGQATLSGEISGAGHIKHVDGGSLTLSGKLSLTGNVISAAGKTIISGDIDNYQGTFEANGGDLEFSYDRNLVFNKNISGSGTILLSGTGTKTFSSDLSKFTGNIAVDKGDLEFGYQEGWEINNSIHVGEGCFKSNAGANMIRNVVTIGSTNKNGSIIVTKDSLSIDGIKSTGSNEAWLNINNGATLKVGASGISHDGGLNNANIFGGGTLELNGNYTCNKALGVDVDKDTSSTVRLMNGAKEITNGIHLANSGSTLAVGDGTTQTTVTYGSNNGAINGKGKLLVEKNASLTVNCQNNYSGGTTVLGSLTVGHQNALGTGEVTIEKDGVLDLSNFTIGNAITNNGGIMLNYQNYQGDMKISTNGVSIKDDYKGALSVSDNIGVTLTGLVNLNESKDPLFSLSGLSLGTNSTVTFDLSNLASLEKGDYILLDVTNGILNNIDQYKCNGQFGEGLTGNLKFNEHNQVILEVKSHAIPEPSSSALAILGLSCLLLMRKVITLLISIIINSILLIKKNILKVIAIADTTDLLGCRI